MENFLKCKFTSREFRSKLFVKIKLSRKCELGQWESSYEQLRGMLLKFKGKVVKAFSSR